MPRHSLVPRKRRAIFLVVGIGIGLAGWISAGAQTVTPRQPQPTGNASVQGVVTDGLSGQAIARARVAVLGAATVNTASDDQGSFEISNLPAGAYSLLVDVPGRGISRFGEMRPDGDSIGFTLNAGQRLHGLALRSWPRATLSGRVTDPDGRPVPGATLEIARRIIMPASYLENYRYTLSTDTDADGRYRAELPAGRYLVTVRATNVTIPAWVQNAYHEELTRPSLGTRVTDRLLLSAAPAITGRGRSVGDFRYQVMAYLRPQVPAAPASPAGVTTTFHSKAREIDLRSGETSSLDFQRDVVASFTISGVVTGPVNGGLVAVRLTSLSEPAMMHFSAGPPVSSETAIAISDADGAFTMLGVPAGRYEVYVHIGNDGPFVPRGQQVGTAASARTELTVDADVKGLALTLRPTPIVTGQIEFVGEPQPTSEQKAAMSFGLYEALLSSTRKPVRPLLHPDGSFRLWGLVPGRYWPVAALGDWNLQNITINGQPFDDRVVLLGDEGLSGVRVVARRWAKRTDVLWGRVSLTPGTDPSEIAAAVFPTNYAERLAVGNLGGRLVSFFRLRQAAFNVGAMPPGDYYVVAYRESEGQDPTKAFFDRLARHASRVAVRDGQATKVELDVAEIGR